MMTTQPQKINDRKSVAAFVPPLPIETERLLLVACEARHLEALLESPARFEREFGWSVADDITEFPEAWEHSLAALRKNPAAAAWGGRMAILKAEGRLVGMGGYKGAPGPNGTVEIGYEVAPAYRGRGLASEITEGLCRRAWVEPGVQTILAHTLPEENASTRVLVKAGFVKTGEVTDPDDGLIWRWEQPRRKVG